ncbi:MAG: hypothetical protein JWM74_2951 [Myxococcaceae bacterium]|jgi:hypothetical protein|nr:hypothetical protein [Myxococcaceae bacterium]
MTSRHSPTYSARARAIASALAVVTAGCGLDLAGRVGASGGLDGAPTIGPDGAPIDVGEDGSVDAMPDDSALGTDTAQAPDAPKPFDAGTDAAEGLKCGATRCLVGEICCLGNHTCKSGGASCGSAGPPLSCNAKTCTGGGTCCAQQDGTGKVTGVLCASTCTSNAQPVCDPATTVCPQGGETCQAETAGTLAGYDVCK